MRCAALSPSASPGAEGAARPLSGARAVREALALALARDPDVVVVGEGVPDPGGVFGTTLGLAEAFPGRVFDAPLAENALMGICVGAALAGQRPVLVHQRVDFLLLALDQLLNNAAKWRAMFGGTGRLPLVVRAVIGRGWGQGPQHGQSLQALLAHVPGLRVVMPVTPADAKGMLCAALEGEDPVVVLEHRWLHGLEGPVPEGWRPSPLEGAVVRRPGEAATVAAFSHMVVEALRAAEALAALGLEVEVLDMRAVAPLDVEAVVRSVARTRRLVVADTGHRRLGVAGELAASVAERAWGLLEAPPRRVALPDWPAPTSPALARHYYPGAREIAAEVLGLCGLPPDGREAAELLRRLEPHGFGDVPGERPLGPF